MRLGPDDLFQGIDGHVLSLRSGEERELAFDGQRADGVEMTAGDVARLVLAGDLLDGRVKVEDCEELGNLAFGFSGLADEIGLRVSVRVAQAGERVGEVERVHVEALPVLDDLVKQHVLLLRRLHPARDLHKARFARCVVAPFTGDNLVDVLGFEEADRDGLENAEPFHRIVEFRLGLGVELAARLVRIGTDEACLDRVRALEPVLAVQRAAGGDEGISERRRRLLAERAAGGRFGRRNGAAARAARLHGRASGRLRLQSCWGHGG